MTAATNRERFHPLSIGAHWLTLLLLVAVYALIELKGVFPKGSEARELAKTWHAMLGLAVFAIVFVRLVPSVKGKSASIFGLELPALTAPDRTLARSPEATHVVIGTAGCFLIGLHAAAALWHHHVQRDDTLPRAAAHPTNPLHQFQSTPRRAS